MFKERVLARAQQDSAVAILDQGHIGQWLIFFESVEALEEERARVLKSHALSEGDTMLILRTSWDSKRYLEVRLGADPDEWRRLVAFTDWVFATFPPCRVYNADSGEDLSAYAWQSLSQILPADDW